MSWFVIDHVNHRRSHLNFSEWSRESPERARELMGDICREVRAGAMPLRSYLLLHPEARLSPEKIASICAWADAQTLTGRGR